jgi:hypothetical protein
MPFESRIGQHDAQLSRPQVAGEAAAWKELVEEELRAILASPHFHESHRCSDFLQFIVGRTLEGRSDELKERTIATEVFGRDLLYEPKLDASVRVKANDLRKRLAQYYQTAGSSAKVRIDLPLGRYIPSFEMIQAAPSPAQAATVSSARRFSSRWALFFLAATCLSILAGFLVIRASHFSVPSELEQFWGIFLPGPKPVVVCTMPAPSVGFANSSKIAERLAAQPDRRRYEIPVDSSLDIGPRLIYEVDGTLAFGDALAVAAVSHSLGEMRRPVIIKGGREVSFQDMKGGPAVLIGAFNNRWAVEINAGLRFNYEPFSGIRDMQTGRSYQVRIDQGRVIEDYGLVSRLVSSRTGGPLMTIGGVKHYGTQAAAEMITEPERIRQLIRALPPGWQTRNVQIVLKTVLVQERPGPPVIVAIHVW